MDIPQDNTSEFNLFSSLQETKEISPEPYDSLSNFPFYPLGDLTYCLSDNMNSIDCSSHQTNTPIKEVAPNITSNPSINKVMQDLFGQTPLDNSILNDDNINHGATVNTSSTHTFIPQIDGAMKDHRPTNGVINPDKYLENILLKAMDIWLGNFDNYSPTFLSYRARINSFIRFLINDKIKLPCENDILAFYNKNFVSRGSSITSGMSPIISFFRWAQMNDIYYNIGRNLKFRRVLNSESAKGPLVRVLNKDPNQESEIIRQFINRPSAIKRIIEFVDSWIDETNFKGQIASEYRTKILYLIGYLQKNDLYLNQNSINAYISGLYGKRPNYLKSSRMAIEEFCTWLRSKGIILNLE